MTPVGDHIDSLRSALGRRSTGRTLALGAGGLALLLVAARAFVLPGVVRAKVEERAARLGLDVAIDAVSVGLASVELSGVTITRAGQTAPLGNIATVDVAGGAFGSAASDLTVVEPHFSLSVDDVRALVDARRARTQAGADPSAARSERALHVRGLNLALHDATGPLLSVESGLVERSAEGAGALSFERVELGAEPQEAVTLSAVRGELAAGERGPRVRSIEVGHGRLRWASNTAESAEGRLLPRLQAVRALVRGDARDGAAPGAPEPAGVAERPWTEGAVLALSDMHVSELGATTTPILSELSLRVQALAAGVFHVKGQGTAPGDGRVSVDVRVEPRALRTEGDVELRNVPLVLFAPVLPPLPFEGLDRTRIGAKLSLSGQGLSAISARGELTLIDLAFASERLAHAPVGPLTVALRGEGTWKPATRELADLKGSLDVGGLHVTTTGSLAWPKGGYDVELSMALPKSSCEAVLRAVPAGLLDELSEVRLGGDITARIDASVHADRLDDTKLTFDVKDHCKFADVPPILDVRRFERPFVHRVVEPDDTVYEFETGPGTGTWAPIELISPFMTQAAIAHEDGRFLGHHGFAPKEIGAALAKNLKARAFRFGASTITMQLVKNVFLHREKVLSRKLQEAFIVWWLEQHWDKRRILELYLNVIEYGPAIYGIRQAALHYFGVTPYDLTPAQAAYLASILPNPKGYYEHFEKGKLSESMKTRMVKFLEHMHERKRIDDEALQDGLAETAAFRFYDPAKPPPPPRVVRGQAEPLPFVRPGGAFPAWDEGYQEDGSFR